jgi:hypothetical protein
MPNYPSYERAPRKGAPLTAARLIEEDEADKAAVLTSGCLGFIRSPYSIIALLTATTRRYYFSLELRNLAYRGTKDHAAVAFVSAAPIRCGIIIIACERS